MQPGSRAELAIGPLVAGQWRLTGPISDADSQDTPTRYQPYPALLGTPADSADSENTTEPPLRLQNLTLEAESPPWGTGPLRASLGANPRAGALLPVRICWQTGLRTMRVGALLAT
jgi:hypothetical protein